MLRYILLGCSFFSIVNICVLADSVNVEKTHNDNIKIANTSKQVSKFEKHQKNTQKQVDKHIFEKLLKAAIHNNKQLDVEQHKVKAGEQDIKTAKARFFPTVNLSCGANYRNTKSTMHSNANSSDPREAQSRDAGYDANIAAEVRFNLFRTGHDVATLKQAQNAVAARKCEFAQSKQQVLLKVAETYLNLYRKIQEHQYLNVLLQARKSALKMAETMFTNGSEKEASVLQARAAFKETENQIATCKSEIDALKANLLELCGITIPDLIPTPEIFDNFKCPNLKDALQQAMSKNLTLRATIAKKNAAEAEFRAKSAAGGLTIDLVGRVEHVTKFNNTLRKEQAARQGNNVKHNVNNVIGIEGRLPVDFGGANRATENAAREMLIAAISEVELIKRNIKKELTESISNYQSADDSVKRAEDAVKDRAAVCRSVWYEYTNGIKTINDVLESQTHLFDASIKLANAISMRIISICRILSLIGQFNETHLKLNKIKI